MEGWRNGDGRLFSYVFLFFFFFLSCSGDVASGLQLHTLLLPTVNIKSRVLLYVLLPQSRDDARLETILP